MKKPTTTYHYTGPIKRFGKTVVANWSDGTQAVSKAQALSRLMYKARKRLKLDRDAKVELNPNNLIQLEKIDRVETKEYNRSYDPDYDIPDEMEEMYGGNIFMKDSEEVVKVHTSDEHEGNYPNYFGYMLIEHPILGDFYVSFSIRGGKVRVDGYPWKFLQEPKYELTREQQDWVMNHKDELSKLSRKVSGTIKLEDNFCTLNPGTVKLKRASKKFNQRDAKFNDADYVDYDDGGSPFSSFKELTKYASEYGLDTKELCPNRITTCCQWIISGDREALLDFVAKYYNEDQTEYIMDCKFKDSKEPVWTKEDFKVYDNSKDEYPEIDVFYKDKIIFTCDHLEYAKRTVNRYLKNMDKFKEEFKIKDSKFRDSYIKMDAYDLRDIFGRYYDEGLKERYNLNVSEEDFCFTGTTKVTGSREDLERFVREHFDNDHYHSNIYSLKSIKDWMPTKTTIDYITEKLDRAGIEYEIEDDVYGETAPFDTWITITRGDDSRADDIICSVVGSAYEWVRDKNGNRRYCKVVTDEDLIDEFNN